MLWNANIPSRMWASPPLDAYSDTFPPTSSRNLTSPGYEALPPTDTKSVRSEDFGFENKSFEKEETELEEKEKIDDDFNLILDKKLLETITENQNSPYSTQASHNPSRRMSAQSIFTELPRR